MKLGTLCSSKKKKVASLKIEERELMVTSAWVSSGLSNYREGETFKRLTCTSWHNVPRRGSVLFDRTRNRSISAVSRYPELRSMANLKNDDSHSYRTAQSTKMADNKFSRGRTSLITIFQPTKFSTNEPSRGWIAFVVHRVRYHTSMSSATVVSVELVIGRIR